MCIAASVSWRQLISTHHVVLFEVAAALIETHHEEEKYYHAGNDEQSEQVLSLFHLLSNCCHLTFSDQMKTSLFE